MNTSHVTLEEQLDFVSHTCSNSPTQLKVKMAAIATLRGLINVRIQIEKAKEPLDSDRFAQTLADVLGESPTIEAST